MEIASLLKYEFQPKDTIISELGMWKTVYYILEDFDEKFYVIINGVVSIQNAIGMFGSGSLAGRSQMSASGMLWSSQMIRMSHGN